MGEARQEFFSSVLARVEGDPVLRGHGKLYMVMLVSQAQFHMENSQFIYFGLEGRMVFFHFWTHWDITELNVQVPREVVLQGFVRAKDMDDAAYVVGRCADQLLFSASIATNAYYSRAEEFVVVDLERSREGRQIRRNAVDISRGSAHDSRRLHYDAFRATAHAVVMNPHHAITTYAAQNYTQALTALRSGSTIMCVAHAFIAVEALKPVVLERYMHASEKSLEQVRDAWNLERTSQVEPAARLMLIFQGDKETYACAREASDGFEHGSKIYQDTVPLADSCYGLTLKYVRDALLSFGDIDDACRSVLEKCKTPLIGSQPASHVSSFAAPPEDFVSGLHPAVDALNEIPYRSNYDDECMTLRFDVAWSEDDPLG